MLKKKWIRKGKGGASLLEKPKAVDASSVNVKKV